MNNVNNIGEMAFIEWRNTVTGEIREVSSPSVDPIKNEPLYYSERQKPSFGLDEPLEDWVFHKSWTEDRYNTGSGRMGPNDIWKSNDGTEVFIFLPNGRTKFLWHEDDVWTSRPNGRITYNHVVFTITDDDLVENPGHDWDVEEL